MRKMSGGSFMLVIFIALMAYNSISSGRFENPSQWLQETLMRLPAIVIGITFHEFAHAFSAYKLGDMTPKSQGRVTLNPISHIDPFGILVLVFVGFGWGRPVQVNPYAFPKNRRLSNLVVDVAGVATNFVIAFICAALLYFIHDRLLFTIVYNIIAINLVLMLFNLLPIPPLDGFGVLTEIFDLRRFSWYRPLYSNGMIILMVVVFFGIAGRLLGPGVEAVMKFLLGFWAPLLL